MRILSPTDPLPEGEACIVQSEFRGHECRVAPQMWSINEGVVLTACPRTGGERRFFVPAHEVYDREARNSLGQLGATRLRPPTEERLDKAIAEASAHIDACDASMWRVLDLCASARVGDRHPTREAAEAAARETFARQRRDDGWDRQLLHVVREHDDFVSLVLDGMLEREREQEEREQAEFERRNQSRFRG